MTSPYLPNMPADLPPIGLRRVVYLRANRAPRTGTVTNDDTKYRNGAYYENDTEWIDESVTPHDIWKLAQIHTKTSATWIKLSPGTSPATLNVLPDLGITPITPDSMGDLTLTSAGGTILVTGVTGPGPGDHTINLETASGNTVSFDVQAHTAPGTDPVVPNPITGIVTVNGTLVAAHSIPIRTDSLAANEYDIELQYSSVSAATDSSKNGLSHFNSAQFDLDAFGFVSLAGSIGPAATKFDVQAHTAPGTDPVVPDGTGTVAVNGTLVAAHGIPIRTDSLAANSFDVEVQYTSAVAATDSSQNGLAHFNSAQFTADASGFVSLTGGVTPPAFKFDVQAHTAPGTDPVVPDGTGKVIVNGTLVAAHDIPIQTDSLAANEMDIEVQYSSAAAASNAAKNGLAHFDSAFFSTNAVGFVSMAATGVVIWNIVSINTNMVKNNGYIVVSPGGAITMALPSSSALGDIIEITLDGATSFQITQAAGQQIRYGSSTTTVGVGGSLTTTAQGDTLRLVCQTANLKWNVLSSIGNFTVV